MAEIFCPIYLHAQNIPDQIAIQTPDRTLTYSQFDAALANQVNLLKTRGIKPHSHAAFIAYPSLSTILLLFSLFRLRAVACPLSFRTPSEQVPLLAARCGAPHLLHAEDFPIVTTPQTHFPSTYGSDQLATILMTSGSTGTPKAACHTINNHMTNAQGAFQPLQCSQSTRWLLSLPLFHVGGLALLFRCFIAGGTVVLSHSPLSDALLDGNMTHASLVPTQLFRLLQEPPEKIAQIASFTTCLLIGGAPLSASLAHKALNHNLPLYTTYGMTEMSSIITLAATQEITTRLHMGKPLPHRELSLNSHGEILVRGATLFSGYWDAEQQQIRPAITEGWFETKDLGEISSEGELTWLGRRDRLFISGGENIQPEEIETALCSLPGILAARVLPIDDPEFGKRPIAYLLEETPSYTLEKIRAALSLKLPSFKHPIQIFPYSEIASKGLCPHK